MFNSPSSLTFLIIIVITLTSLNLLRDHQVSGSSIGSEYPTFSKLLLERAVDRLRNLTTTAQQQQNRRTSLTLAASSEPPVNVLTFIPHQFQFSATKNNNNNNASSSTTTDDQNKDEDLAQPGFQDFMERLSDVGLGYIIRDLYTAAITEDNEIETVLGDLGRIGVGALVLQKVSESKKFNELPISTALRRLSRYIGVGITLVGSYFDLYLLFDSIGCLVRRRRLEAATGIRQLKFSNDDEQTNEIMKSMMSEKEYDHYLNEKPTVFCKREHPILEIIAACIATVADSVTFVTPQYGEHAALVEALWQVIAFYYVAAEERKEEEEEEDGRTRREGRRNLRKQKFQKIEKIFKQLQTFLDPLHSTRNTNSYQ